MTCTSRFTVSDGTLVVDVTAGALSDAFEISRELSSEGQDTIRYADGHGELYSRFEVIQYTITGGGPADPGLWALDRSVPSWTVTIPGFADGSANEVWTVLPARPQHRRNRRGTGHSWTLTLEAA